MDRITTGQEEEEGEEKQEQEQESALHVEEE